MFGSSDLHGFELERCLSLSRLDQCRRVAHRVAAVRSHVPGGDEDDDDEEDDDHCDDDFDDDVAHCRPLAVGSHVPGGLPDGRGGYIEGTKKK